MKQPRKWSIILTGPNSGPISHHGDLWERCPAHFERVQVQEILPDAAPQAEQGGAVDQLAASLGMVQSGEGWHIAPGHPLVYQNPADAIRDLVIGLRLAKAAPKREIEQLGLF